jgi:peptidoglycan/LPS O-acetylase OafA/YrhL
VAGGLYRLERRAPQQVALFVAAVATLVAAGNELGWSWARPESGGLLALGAVWLELGRRRLVEPRRTSEALGALGLGAEALTTVGPGAGDGLGQGGWGLWLGLVAAAALLARLRPAGTRAHPAGTRDR